MRNVLVLAAAALLAGCATTSSSMGINPHVSSTPWESAGATSMGCAASPILCSRMADAAQRYNRAGPFMPY